MKVVLDIPDRVADALPENFAGEPHRLLLELACGLFAAHKLTHAQACELAGLDRLGFQEELGLREIPLHYSLENLQNDISFARR